MMAAGFKRGDRIRVTGRTHPWRGAAGVILYSDSRPVTGEPWWVLQLDAPWGHEGVHRQACASEADIGPEDALPEPVTIAEAWRQCGGGTPEFDQAAFAEVVGRGDLTATARCRADCGDRLPSRCWWAALGAAVRAPRQRREAVTEWQPSLF